MNLLINMFYNLKNNVLYISILLVLSLLLITHNFSVAIIAIISVFSFISILIKGLAKLNSFDKVVIFVFLSYFLGAIPVAIIDGSTLRYFQGGSRLLLCLPIYFLLREHVEIKKTHVIKAMQFGAFIGSIGSCLFAIYQFYILSMPRVDGYLFSINFGYLACSLIFLCIGLAVKSNLKIFLYIAASMAWISTVLTLSRGAILAVPLLMCFAAIVNIKRISTKKLSVIFLFLVFASVATYIASDSVRMRTDYTIHEVTSIMNGDISKSHSTGGRLQLWLAASYAFLDSPTTGLPYAEREKLNRQLVENGTVSEWVTTVARGHAHSQYFEMLASNGIWGIISIIFIFFVPLYIFTNHFLNSDSIIGYTGALFVAGFMVYGLTEAPLQANLIGSYYGFMLSVFFAIVYKEKYTITEKQT